MKNYIATISLTILVFLSGLSLASTADSSSFLKIGDKVPDIEFKIKNYPKHTAKISDFKGKLVILDLWGVNCGSCIAAMPHMAELQKKFEGKLQVIMVTKDSDEKVTKQALHSDNVKNNKLPSVTNAKELAGLFDYRYLPTHVWIDENGIVKYITNGSNANEGNIDKHLKGNLLQFRVKKDLKMDKEDPMLVNWYPYHKEISFYTYLAPVQKEYSANMGYGQRLYPDSTIKKLYSGCSSLDHLYSLAFGLNGKSFSRSRIINLSKNAEKYKVDPDEDYRKQNGYFSYEVVNGIKLGNEKIFKYMQNELNTIFGLKSGWEKQPIKCYVIKQKKNSKLIYSNGGGYKLDYGKGMLTVRNFKWEYFLRAQRNSSTLDFELIDETGIPAEQLVSLSIKSNWRNIHNINESLEKYGLFVEEQIRLFDCIVLRDADN